MRSPSMRTSAAPAPPSVTTVPPRISTGSRLESDLLGALPEDDPAQLLQILGALGDGGEVVARQLPHLRAEAGGAVGKEDLRLAEAPGIEQDLASRRIAGGVLGAEAELEVSERDPGRLAAPAGLDYLGAQRQQGPEGGHRPGRRRFLQASREAVLGGLDSEHRTESGRNGYDALDTCPRPRRGPARRGRGRAPARARRRERRLRPDRRRRAPALRGRVRSRGLHAAHPARRPDPAVRLAQPAGPAPRAAPLPPAGAGFALRPHDVSR